MSTTHHLTTTEQRGFLTVMNGRYYEPETVEGWFHVNNQGVIMRKIGGRNRYFFASISDVLDFVASESKR